jgi:hypothetical protein
MVGMNLQLLQRVAVATGASKGIGLAVPRSGDVRLCSAPRP